MMTEICNIEYCWYNDLGIDLFSFTISTHYLSDLIDFKYHSYTNGSQISISSPDFSKHMNVYASL